MERARISCALLIAVLTGCGGGSDGNQASNTPPPPPTSAGVPFGLWEGTTGDGRGLAGLVIPMSRWYGFIYTAQNNDQVIAGVVEGDLYYDSSTGKLWSEDAKDFNMEGAGILDARIDGTFREKQTISGTVDYAGSQVSSTFTASYNSTYQGEARVGDIAGRYVGAAYAGFTEYAELTISPPPSTSAAGGVVGQSASGCVFTGTVAPGSGGNYYVVSIKGGNDICVMGTNIFQGYAYFDSATSTMYSVGLSSARDSGFLFVGTKQ